MHMRRTFWMDGRKAAAAQDYSKAEADSKTSMTLSTAEAPLFSFLGKSRFEFYSNDTAVLGSHHRTVAAPSQRSESSAHAGGDRDARLGYDASMAPEQKFSIFSYNYDPDTNKAVDDIVLLQSGASTITCKDCYLYAGEMRST
jgi:hypothetical protein